MEATKTKKLTKSQVVNLIKIKKRAEKVIKDKTKKNAV